MRSHLAAALAAGLLTATVSATVTVTPATAARPADTAHVTTVTVHRGGKDATIGFHRGRPGEAFLTAIVSARGISWDDPGNESAVVSVHVDGHYVTDIVITSAGPVKREFALGHLDAGRHRLRLHYATKRSPSDAGAARLQGIGITTVPRSDPSYAAARFAPVLFGRDVAGLGGRYQNNRTDTPLIAWHQVLPAARPSHSVLEYSVTWSNEDGGTGASAGALMAQWGRTTDIEWVYRVEINARGGRVPHTGVFQGPRHTTRHFHGRYDGTHPLIQTCTSNNNVCAHVDDPMRFGLSTRDVLPDGQTREREMDLHPWTYQVMAREMLREGKVETPSNPDSVALGDQRTYLYAALTHDTTPAAGALLTGLTLEVRLKNDTTYTSNHGQAIAFLTVNRNGPAATTVELPAGTTPGDIASISVRRVASGADNGATLTVTDLDRAFFLGSDYLPGSSFADFHGSVTLTGASPTAQLWPAA